MLYSTSGLRSAPFGQKTVPQKARNFWHRTALSKTILQQNRKFGVYNTDMARKIRLLLAILILALSLALLIWGLWPIIMETRIVPVDPDQMQLPTPVSFYFGLGG